MGKSCEAKRLKAAQEEMQRKEDIKQLIALYDKNKSGKLERDQLIKLMTDMDDFSPEGVPPTDEQVEFIFKTADKVGDGAIDPDELEDALACWATFSENREEFVEKLEKYDKSGTGKLSRDELKL